jgi:hypothetical protein
MAQASRGLQGGRTGLALLFLVGVLVLGTGQPTVEVWGQGAGPLTQYAQNVHQWHIIARYFTTANGTRVQVNLVQTVTATAVKSTERATFWLIEPQHIDPQFFYDPDNPPSVPRGTPIQFFYFVDTINPSALVSPSPGVPVDVVRRTSTYALLRENRGRGVRELPIATEINSGDSVVVAVLRGSSLMSPGRFEERQAKITSVQQNVFFIDLNLGEMSGNSSVHGAPVFVRQGGAWKLAGIFLAHVTSSRRGESAIARLPVLDALVPQEVQKPDRDNDGVPDDEDRCPNIPGDPENDGCPSF